MTKTLTRRSVENKNQNCYGADYVVEILSKNLCMAAQIGW